MPGVNIEGVLDSKLGIINGFRRYDDGRHRFYYRMFDGKPELLTGITTIIRGIYPTSQYLIDFIVENPDVGWISARYGSLFHHLVEMFLKGANWFEDLPPIESPDYRKIRKEMISFKRFFDTFQIKPRLVEVPLKGTIRGCSYVTTLDLVIDVKFDFPLPKKRNQEREFETRTETWIVDLKSNYLEKARKAFLPEVHLPQLLAQKVAFEQSFPSERVDRIFNWAATAWLDDKGDNTYSLVEWTKVPKEKKMWNYKGYKKADEDAFYALMAVAKKKKLNIPRGSFEIFEDFTTSSRGRSVYRRQTYQAWVKEVLSVPKKA